jgi:alpha/beta superfamily hydrolase
LRRRMDRAVVKIPCGDFTLEGIFELPDESRSYPVVIICHPHPLHGGDLHNYVVGAISRELLRRSIATLRFNFRGVGRSGGSFGDGIGEQRDLEAAIEFALSQKNVDPAGLGLAGYSFGGGVSVPVAFRDESVKALALVSPSLDDTDWNLLKGYHRPKILICGREDAFFPYEMFEENFKSVPEPKKLLIVDRADHFWQGLEVEVATKLGGFLKDTLG